MTITQEKATAVDDPRDLISSSLFAKLVARVQEEMPVATFYAERVIEQTLVFLVAIAQSGENREGSGDSKLSPSRAVDPGWHAFLVFTSEYAEFCRQITGGAFIHHLPVEPGKPLWWKSVDYTMERMRATGYPVDEAMWEKDASCGSTDNCDFRVAAL